MPDRTVTPSRQRPDWMSGAGLGCPVCGAGAKDGCEHMHPPEGYASMGAPPSMGAVQVVGEGMSSVAQGHSHRYVKIYNAGRYIALLYPAQGHMHVLDVAALALQKSGGAAVSSPDGVGPHRHTVNF